MKAAHALLPNLENWMMSKIESTVAAPREEAEAEAEALEMRGIEVLRLMVAAAFPVPGMIEAPLMMIMRTTTAPREIVTCHVEMHHPNGIGVPVCTSQSSPRP
jgi:hypothetical protein